MNFPQPSSSSLLFYRAALEHGAQLPIGPRSQVKITGTDRVNFLHGFCTADIKKLLPGEACEAFITNHQGKVAGHVLVLADEDSLILNGAAGQAGKWIAHLDRFVISEQVTFTDQSASLASELIIGPKAEEFLPETAGNAPGGLQHITQAFGEAAARVCRVNFLGNMPAGLLITSPEELWMLRAALGGLGGIGSADEVTSAVVWEMLRVEAGYPLYGQDITEENLPQEVQRDAQAISFTKGCYLGQETIARLDALGHVNRVLTGLKFLGDKALQPGETIMQGEKKIAQITSLAWSPKLQAPLALAYVRTLHATPGKRLAFEGGEAEVIQLPLEQEVHA